MLVRLHRMKWEAEAGDGHEYPRRAGGSVKAGAAVEKYRKPMMNFRYTRRQVARGSRPDATDGGANWYLLKFVSELRLTYQIRLLTYAAGESGARLTIRVPRLCEISSPLRDFLKEHKARVKLERVD